MTKKKIIGGLNKLEGTFNSGTHRLDGVSDFIYAQYDVETHPDPERINSQKQFTLYRFFDITEYKSENFKLPNSIDTEKIKTIFFFGYRDDWIDKTFFVKKNKNTTDSNFIKNNIGKILYKLYENDSSKTEIILVHYNNQNNGGLYIILNMTGSDNKYNNLKNYLLSPSDFEDDNNLTKKLNFSYLKNLIQFTDKYLPLPKIDLSTNDLNRDFSETQINEALNASGIGSIEELDKLIISINSTPPPSIGGGKIKKKNKLMNAGSNNSSDKRIENLEKIKKFYEELKNTNPDDEFDKNKQLDIINKTLAKLSNAKKKIDIENSIVRRNVEKNSDSRIAKYGKYAAMGTLSTIASPIVITATVVNLATIGALGVVATPIALVASPIYYAYLKYNKQIYNNNIKTINKLTLLESLLFIPKPKISSIAHNKLRLLESLLFIP